MCSSASGEVQNNVSRVSAEQEWRLRGAALERSSNSFRAASEISLALASDVQR
jgi:hypothetical protein